MTKLYSLFLSLFAITLWAQSPEVIANMEGKNHLSEVSTSNIWSRDNPDFIDVQTYELFFEFNSSLQTFTGASTITFLMLEEQNHVTFDAQSNLSILEVLDADGASLNFSRGSNTVEVELGQLYPINSEHTVTVHFQSSIQASAGMTKENVSGNTPVIATLSEPANASSWWVGIDNLKDKADAVDIIIKHPSRFKVGSNGVLLSTETVGNETTTHWRTEYPIPAYLVSIAMSEYVEYSNVAYIGDVEMPVINYVYENQLSNQVMSQLDAVPSYIEFFSGLIGDYPYKNEKYGHSQWEWGGGMEHATMSSQVNFDTSLTAHELAHQWFGDKVTCSTWSDIWLNEGFATYFEGLLRRNLYGEEFFTEWKYGRAYYVMSDEGGSVYIPPADLNQPGRIFDARLSYYKGAMVAHMLRYTLGDGDFYQALTNYLNDPALTYSFASTSDLKNHFETQSGRDLDEFFNDWVYGEGFPYFYVNMDYNESTHTGILTLDQVPSHASVDFYETDFEIGLQRANGEIEYRRFSLLEEGQTFIVEDIPSDFVSYEFNPKYDILAYALETTLGTDNITNETQPKFSLYPNPAQDFIYLMHPEKISKVEIYDAKGSLVKVKIINDREADIYIQDLSVGSYILKATTTAGVETKKFLKR